MKSFLFEKKPLFRIPVLSPPLKVGLGHAPRFVRQHRGSQVSMGKLRGTPDDSRKMASCWIVKSVLSSCCYGFKPVNGLRSFMIFSRFSFQGKINGINHVQPPRTIALASSRRRNEQETTKGEQQEIVLLVDQTGSKQGEMSLNEALRIARAKSLEVVWVNRSDKSAMPVYRMMSKLDIKLKGRPLKLLKTKKIEVTDKIESHDLKFRVKRIQQYLEKGHQVKLFVKSKAGTSSEVKLNVIKKVQQELQGVQAGRPIEENPQLITCLFKSSHASDVNINSSKTD